MGHKRDCQPHVIDRATNGCIQCKRDLDRLTGPERRLARWADTASPAVTSRMLDVMCIAANGRKLTNLTDKELTSVANDVLEHVIRNDGHRDEPLPAAGDIVAAFLALTLADVRARAGGSI